MGQGSFIHFPLLNSIANLDHNLSVSAHLLSKAYGRRLQLFLLFLILVQFYIINHKISNTFSVSFASPDLVVIF